MKVHVITLFPDLVRQGLSEGVVSRAFNEGKANLDLVNPRDFAVDKHQTVDDKPFGGADGMLMMSGPLEKALSSIEEPGEIVYLSPRGDRWDHETCVKWAASKPAVTLICGRYAGVDQRFLERHKVREVSIGDYVLSGGELPALVLVDSLVRQLPGVLGNEQSAIHDSFSGGLLEAPQFTRPREDVWGWVVPEVLTNGNHQKIEEFKLHMSVLYTLRNRPDLLSESKPIPVVKALKYGLGLSDVELKSCGLRRTWLKDKYEQYKD